MKPPKRLLVPVVLVLAAGAYALRSRERVTPGAVVASGTVEATEARLGFQAAGRIDTVQVREGDAVAAGVELARLEQSEMRARQEARKLEDNCKRRG